MKLSRTLAIGSLIVLGTSFEATPANLHPWPGEELSGGATTVFDTRSSAFGRMVANLDPSRWIAVRAGKSLFANPWVPRGQSASPGARPGLGPRFNADSCAGCHFRDGRVGPQEPGVEASPPLLVRLAIPASRGGWGPEPTYGAQLNERAVGIPAEGTLQVEYEEVVGHYGDGEPYRLRRPSYRIQGLSRGPLHADAQLTVLMPPSLIGLGLLEAVPVGQLQDLADPEDTDGDGISGRIPPSLEDDSGIGRFGWKATQPNLESQIALAFSEDMGIMSTAYPQGNCAAKDAACRRLAGAERDLSPTQLARVTLYTRLLAPPARRDVESSEVLEGRNLFLELGCASCHSPRLRTVEAGSKGEVLPELSGQIIRPYSDLLLHDLGPELAGGFPDGGAESGEWRTPALWGLGLHRQVSGSIFLLHDGRARSIEEAILWHGGEAEAARLAFVASSARQRRAVLRFLNSL
ncbi:MAG: thiol oxidoreductase [Deltaproteobacteria bacterium]|nr:thiol oxidoreductase [Deltaproteobacteria bacterium]